VIRGGGVLGYSIMCLRIMAETLCHDSQKFEPERTRIQTSILITITDGIRTCRCQNEFFLLVSPILRQVSDNILYINGLLYGAISTARQCSVICPSTVQLNFLRSPTDHPPSKTTHSCPFVYHSRHLFHLIPTYLNVLWHFTKHFL
jgi:hypothetical protein